MEATIKQILPLLESEIVIVGEGRGEGRQGNTFSALIDMFNNEAETPRSDVLVYSRV